MKIILASENIKKKRSIDIALKSLGIDDYEIICMKVDSKVGAKPINDDVIIGAKNRAKYLYDYCIQNNVSFDLVIGIEGGYEQVNFNNYFITSYSSIITKDGLEFLGKSQSVQISKNMFEWTKQGYSLNEVICDLNNKERKDLTSYLSNGYYERDVFDSSAVLSALYSAFNFNNNFKKLDNYLEERLSHISKVA